MSPSVLAPPAFFLVVLQCLPACTVRLGSITQCSWRQKTPEGKLNPVVTEWRVVGNCPAFQSRSQTQTPPN